jgi:predicted Zn-dependent peptidase
MPEEKLKWIDKVLDQFMEEIENPPQEPDEEKLQRKIMTIIQYRANGLDHRRMGLLAADLYRLLHATSHRIIEDLAKVTVKAKTAAATKEGE